MEKSMYAWSSAVRFLGKMFKQDGDVDRRDLRLTATEQNGAAHLLEMLAEEIDEQRK